MIVQSEDEFEIQEHTFNFYQEVRGRLIDI